MSTNPIRSRRAAIAAIGGVAALVVVVVVVFAFVLGSGDGASDEPDDKPQVAATDRSMAAMVLDRVERDSTSYGESYSVDDYPKGSIGARVNFDSDVLSLYPAAIPDVDAYQENRCDAPDSVMTGCREKRLDDGSQLRVRWQDGTPEEDPGIVYLEVRRDNQTVVLGMTGPEIHGDPAKTDDLPVALDDLVDIVTDPAFGLRTSQRYVDEGEALEDWKTY